MIISHSLSFSHILPQLFQAMQQGESSASVTPEYSLSSKCCHVKFRVTPIRVREPRNDCGALIWVGKLPEDGLSEGSGVPSLQKTLEIMTLDPSADQIVMCSELTCATCTEVLGHRFTHYFDCSDNQLSLEYGTRFVKRPLECAFDANEFTITPELKGISAGNSSSSPKRNVEEVLKKLPTHVLEHLPPLPETSAFAGEYGKTLQEKGPKSVLICAQAMQMFLSGEFEVLSALLSVVSDSMTVPMSSTSKTGQQVKERRKKDLDDVHSTLRKGFSRILTSETRGSSEQLEMLYDKATYAQEHQLPYWDGPKGALPREMEAINRTRNAVAHTRDVTGCERRFLLRLFYMYFGNGRVDAAVEFLRSLMDNGFDTALLKL